MRVWLMKFNCREKRYNRIYAIRRGIFPYFLVLFFIIFILRRLAIQLVAH